MTTFSKNPYVEVRKIVNRLVFRKNLDQTLDSKFKHKQFSERFALANRAFVGLGFIAQLASMTTAFVMLSYLFVSTPTIVRVLCSVVLVLAIEIIKRQSTDDVMQGLFQYKEVERFSIILALIATGASIYIAIEGAKILPSLLVRDSVEKIAVVEKADPINEKYDTQKSELIAEREEYKTTSKWQGRIAGKDRKEIQKLNDRIAAVEHKRDSALQALAAGNESLRQATVKENEAQKVRMKQERSELGDQLVIAAVGFEVLFLLSMCFSWWYYVECEKERQELKTAQIANNSAVTTEITTNTPEVTSDTSQVRVQTIGARATKKMSFRDYEETPTETSVEVERVKKDYTRICPQCGTPFVHKNHNHTYCTRSCYLAARKKNATDK